MVHGPPLLYRYIAADSRGVIGETGLSPVKVRGPMLGRGQIEKNKTMLFLYFKGVPSDN